MILKKLILSIFLTTISISAYSQKWITNFDDAKNSASEENKNIVLVFQGSDWCAPCIKLDREIWKTTEFKNFAKEHFILVKADFPRKNKNKLSKTQQLNNENLMEMYNTNGYFPFVVVLDKNGKVLGNTGYTKTTPSKYIELLSSF
jgi:thioredoxin-related protein